MRTVLVCLCALVLSGCFYSQDPLIGRFRADFPLETGRYSHTPYDENGEPWLRPAWTGDIHRNGRRYVSDDDGFPHEGIRMRELVDGVYAVQKPDGEHFVYGLMFFYPDGIATYHMPNCAALQDAALETYSVVREEEGYCRVDDWNALSAVLQIYLTNVGDEMLIDGIYRRLETD
jgi:hypothetical protein